MLDGDRGARRRRCRYVEFGDDRTVDVVLRASRRSESARVAEKVNELDGRRARAVAALKARLASGNAHKLEELRAALPGWELELLETAEPFPAEEGETYYENARAKAEFGRRVGAPDAWMLGEDSGIEVAALGGRPGIASARWAEDGVAQLLEELQRRRATGAPGTCASSSRSPRTARSGAGPASSRARSRPSAAARRASATTRSSSPEGEERTVAELGNAWKRRELPPRPRRAA